MSKELIDSVTIESVTMAAWIKAEAGGNDGATFETATEGEIMVREEAYEIALRSGTGVLQAAFGTGGGESSAPWSTPCWAWYGNQIIPAHEWSHVAVSFDHTNEQQKYYVGGVQVESGSPCDPGAYGGNPLTVNEHPFQIGARMHERYTHNQMEHNDNVGHAEFMGDIDEAMLFNAAIDAEQVHYVYSLAYRSKKAGPPVPRIAGTADASRLPSSLVGYWPLDGDGTDLGRNGMTGMDPMPRWVGGKFDLAITFGNGNGFVVPDVGGAMAGITSAVTMIAYVRPTQYEACGDRGIIMNKEGSFEYGVESNTGAMQGAMSACWRWWGNVRLSLYDWTMTAVSFDGTDEIHMLNGVEVERTACAGAIESQASPLTIGARPAGNSRDASTSEPAWSQFTGDVDEAMLFSSALSSREISDVYRVSYRSGADPLPVEGEANVDTLKSHTGCRGGKALVGLWPLDGDGDDLTDADASSTFGHNLAGNDLHLTATNAQYVSGIYGQAFRFDGDDLLQVEQQDQALEADYVTMLSWVRPVRYQFIAGTARDRGIVSVTICCVLYRPSSALCVPPNANATPRADHEQRAQLRIRARGHHRQPTRGVRSVRAMLSRSETRPPSNLPTYRGCWRWWGSIRVPLHEWTHVAAQYDGTNEKHFVNGKMAEQTDCAGAALTKHPENYLRIGARYWSNQGDMSHQQGSSQFRGDIDVRRPRPSIHSPPCPLLTRGCVVGRRCCFSAGRVRPIRSASLTSPTSIRAPTGQAAAEATSSAGASVALCIRVPVDLWKTIHSKSVPASGVIVVILILDANPVAEGHQELRKNYVPVAVFVHLRHPRHERLRRARVLEGRPHLAQHDHALVGHVEDVEGIDGHLEGLAEARRLRQLLQQVAEAQEYQELLEAELLVAVLIRSREDGGHLLRRHLGSHLAQRRGHLRHLDRPALVRVDLLEDALHGLEHLGHLRELQLDLDELRLGLSRRGDRGQHLGDLGLQRGGRRVIRARRGDDRRQRRAIQRLRLRLAADLAHGLAAEGRHLRSKSPEEDGQLLAAPRCSAETALLRFCRPGCSLRQKSD